MTAVAHGLLDRAMRSRWARHYFFIPEIFAVIVALPTALMVFDRAPPLVLYDGQINPPIVRPGQMVDVRWRAHFAGRDCPGLTQREIVDAKNNLWPKMIRGRRGVFTPSASDPLDGWVETPPLEIPDQIAPGIAHYKVTQFYYCNPLQRWLDWPIVQASPSIAFEVREQ